MSDQLEPCEACAATGSTHHDCEPCDGEGYVEDPSDGGTMTCPACGGHEYCPKCDGEGYLEPATNSEPEDPKQLD